VPLSPLPAFHFQRLSFTAFLRQAVIVAALPAGIAQAQTPAPPAPGGSCPVQPSYPLPSAPAELNALADRLEPLAHLKGCLTDAHFHAWRGAVLMALGRSEEAIEPLERALMEDPELPGAQLDLAQAFAVQGDAASARAMLQGLRTRTDVPEALRRAIDLQFAALSGAGVAANAEGKAFFSRWRVSTLGGVDSNLNNAPANSEITLTLPEGNRTLPLDPSSLPRRGSAAITSFGWQGLGVSGRSVWVLQAELKARHSGEITSYEQTDLAAAWLQAPAESHQWVVRTGFSNLRFGGVGLLQSFRGNLQRQFAPMDSLAACRPALGMETEWRRYPTSLTLNGLYTGGTVGVTCRPADAKPESPQSFTLEGRLGQDRPSDATRAGGVYDRAEVRVQWERPIFLRGQMALQWASTLQRDTDPYSPLLGNIPRHTTRHALQLDTSWPLRGPLSVVTSLEASNQSSNITAFATRQRSFYVGLQWQLMQ
jgi:hypothetical protein